jgi:hypothetical protein
MMVQCNCRHVKLDSQHHNLDFLAFFQGNFRGPLALSLAGCHFEHLQELECYQCVVCSVFQFFPDLFPDSDFFLDVDAFHLVLLAQCCLQLLFRQPYNLLSLFLMAAAFCSSSFWACSLSLLLQEA